MVTDPPYGVEYDPKWRNESLDAWKVSRSLDVVVNDDVIDWKDVFKLWNAAVCYAWHAGKFANIVADSLVAAGYEIVSQIIWAKQHFVISRGDYHWQHEPCWYAVRKGSKHNWQGARDQSTLWTIANHSAFGGSDEEKTTHSTQKPIECMMRPIANNTTVGDVVCDPFLGSGTTLIAAEKLQRVCYAAEINPAYCDISLKRFYNLTKQIPVRHDGVLFPVEVSDGTSGDLNVTNV